MHMNAEPGGESPAFSIHVFHERQEVKLRRLLGNSFCQNGHPQNLKFIGLLMQNTVLISLEERPFFCCYCFSNVTQGVLKIPGKLLNIFGKPLDGTRDASTFAHTFHTLRPLNIILPTSKDQGLDHQILATSLNLFQSILYFADSVLFTSQKGSCHRLKAVSCFSRSHRICSKLCMGVLSL